MSDNHAVVNYNQITKFIWVGTNFCCMDHFEEELLEIGITTDISLEEKRVDSPFGTTTYLWLPTKDGFPPSDYQLDVGVATLDQAVENGQKIYVHCQNGHGRAPTLVAAYLVKNKNISSEDAYDLIKSKRPEVHPTPKQMEAIKKYKEMLGN